MTCDECGMRPAVEGRETCYRCHLVSVGYVFRGGGHMYGRQNFSARTNAEYVAEHVGDVNRPGIAHLGSQEWSG